MVPVLWAVCMGVYLAEAGHEVTLIDIRPDIVEAIKRDGLRLDGVRGEHRTTVDSATPDTASGPSDVVIVVAHTDGTLAAAQLTARLLTDDGCAITLQNGIGNVEALVDAIGPQRVLGGSSYNSATFNGPGRHDAHQRRGRRGSATSTASAPVPWTICTGRSSKPASKCRFRTTSSA